MRVFPKVASKRRAVWGVLVLWGVLAVLVTGQGSVLTAGSAFVGHVSTPDVHTPAGRVVLVLINRLSLNDVSSHPRWQALAAGSWFGGMTLKTARGHGDVHQAVTLGAGALAAGHKDVSGFDADEWVEAAGGTAADWYRQMTGRALNEGVLVPAIGLLVRENEPSSRFPAVPGALGTRIQEAGGMTAVFGNSDRGTKPKRLAPLVTMDETGWTPWGEVGRGMVRSAPDRPFGVATHYERMLVQLRQLPPDVWLAVFELGDLDRLAAVRQKMAVGHAELLRRQILSEMADFVQVLISWLRPGDSLWVVSPMVDEDSYQKGMWLAPVLWWPTPSAGGGLLVSDSTRRAGFVTNLDVTATILAQLGIPRPAGMAGRPLRPAASSEPVEPTGFYGRETTLKQAAFWDELARTQWAHQLRPQVLRPHVFLQMGLMLVAAVVWGLRLQRGYRPVRLLLLAMLFAPTVLLMLSVPKMTFWHVLLFVWAVSILAAALAERVSWRFALLTAAVSVWLLVAVDMMRGGVWLKRSLLSYDPMLAARFYGIGNEYMGIVVGAVILTAALVWEWAEKHSRRWLTQWIWWGVAGGMLAWLAVMAAPWAGANAGGAVTAGVGFVTTWVFLRFPGPSPGRLLWSLLIGLLLAFMSLFVLNAWWTNDEGNGLSHVGEAWQAAGGGQWEELRSMAVRKLETNWRLIRHSIWTKVFALSLIVSFIVQLLPGTGRSPQMSPAWAAAFRGILAASVAALLFNDSGIVAAATAIVYLVVPKLILEATKRSIL